MRDASFEPDLPTRITDILDAHGIVYRWLHHTEPVFTVEAAAQ
jgi:hypothetical protein